MLRVEANRKRDHLQQMRLTQRRLRQILCEVPQENPVFMVSAPGNRSLQASGLLSSVQAFRRSTPGVCPDGGGLGLRAHPAVFRGCLPAERSVVAHVGRACRGWACRPRQASLITAPAAWHCPVPVPREDPRPEAAVWACPRTRRPCADRLPFPRSR